jgi:CheY-like chemotaxis protein
MEVNLERQGYNVRCASCSAEILEQVAEQKPELILVEVMDIDFDVLKTLKRNPDTRDIHIICVSRQVKAADVFKGWPPGTGGSSGFYEFLWDEKEDDEDETVQ